jgi:poly(3-hydroxybutyrate) depolymerase
MDCSMSTLNAVKLASGLAFAPFEAAATLASGWTEYTAGAIKRRATPLDVVEDLAEWWRVATVRERPKWANPSTVIREWPIARLRDYSTEAPTATVATIVLPPQAGHDSCIVDYAPAQSQMLTLRNEGLDRLYTLEWLGATSATATAGVDDYINVLADTIASVGGRANLVGDCQGGWFAVIYAALFPDQVNTLTIAGAPIDFHAGKSVIRDWMDVLSRDYDMSFYKALVASGGGVHRGDNQLAGFKMLEPVGELDRTMDLLNHINDEEFVSRHIEFTNWFEWTQDVPGAFYLWIVENLFARNQLINKELEIGGQVVDLAKIDCPVYLIAGATDHITPPEQVWALADHVSTSPDQIEKRLVESGHLGLFMGHEALHNHWAPLMAKVSAISH